MWTRFLSSIVPLTSSCANPGFAVFLPARLKYAMLNASPAITNLEYFHVQAPRQHPTLSVPGAPGRSTSLRSAVLGVLCMCSAPRAAALPGGTQAATTKGPWRPTMGHVSSSARLPMCLCSCSDCRKICEALVYTGQFEISFAASREALGPGIGTCAASCQQSYL